MGGIGISFKASRTLKRCKLTTIFVALHSLLGKFMGCLQAFAPDEGAYSYTFNNFLAPHQIEILSTTVVG